LDAFNFSLQNLFVLMGILMFSFGVIWFINGVWKTRKLVPPLPAPAD
jgi:hypothetical protein